MAQLTFASMIHRGFLADQDATAEVVVTVSGQPAITRQVPVMTPGDVIGIPARQVIRCAPANGLVDAEPNFVATIELASADLPWLFSRTPASGPILPWITLAVIDVTDLAQDPLSSSPIGTQLTIAAAQLPNPADAWMWAHGQQLDGDQALSRLVSSRRLAAQRRYLACVVPVFAAGRSDRPQQAKTRRVSPLTRVGRVTPDVASAVCPVVTARTCGARAASSPGPVPSRRNGISTTRGAGPGLR